MWSKKSTEVVLKELAVNSATGLSEHEVVQRREKYSANELAIISLKPYLEFFSLN
ncbi:cation-transporting P-type ATPase [Desulfosporosinus fructosivorans]